MNHIECSFDQAFRRAAWQRELWCAPIHRQLAHLHSLQITRVLIVPAGVEVETVWTPEAARMRDGLLEIIDWYTREAFKPLMYQPAGEVPPEDPRRLLLLPFAMLRPCLRSTASPARSQGRR